MRNGHYPLPPLRPELQAAHDEMDAKGDYFAYAGSIQKTEFKAR